LKQSRVYSTSQNGKYAETTRTFREKQYDQIRLDSTVLQEAKLSLG